ncbi:MAG: glycosyltransferase family 4 protein [Solirubrobacteraceae bacterium]
MIPDAPPPPIRVLALIDHFVLGGAETLLTRFALAAPRANIELSVACLQELDGNPAAAPLVAAGHPPVNLNLVGRPGPHTIRALRAHIRRTQAQIVHTHLGNSDLLGGVAARSLGVPAVCTLHTTLWNPRVDHIARRVVRVCCARVVAVSESARREYLRHGWAGEQQVITIHNGIDLAPEPGAGAEVRAALGIAPDDVVVAMVSALRPEKGHEVAIDAVERLRPRFPNLRLLIAGQGDLRNRLAERAGRLGGAVVLAGLRPDVMRVFDAADVCLHPSTREALPTTLMEAMAASVPVVATRVGGIPEIVTDGSDGLLVPAPAKPGALADALAQLLGDAALRRAMGVAARRTYEARFTADPWIRRTRTLYDEILAERAGGRRAGRRLSARRRRAATA